jgi:hypothetical protein
LKYNEWANAYENSTEIPGLRKALDKPFRPSGNMGTQKASDCLRILEQ